MDMAVLKTTEGICSAPGCGQPVGPRGVRGFCSKDYQRLRSSGQLSNLPTKTAEERFWSKVDKDGPTMPHMETACWVWTGAIFKQTGYGAFRLQGRITCAHRMAWDLAGGENPAGLKIDHRCHNRPCVNWGHLRLATDSQNGQNRRGLDANNSSGYRGVHFHQPKGCVSPGWIAEMKHEGERLYLGRFKTAEAADEAVVAKRNELFTHNELDRQRPNGHGRSQDD